MFFDYSLIKNVQVIAREIFRWNHISDTRVATEVF